MTGSDYDGPVLELATSDGRAVCRIRSVVAGLLAYTGHPPEIVVWGQRTFTLAPGWEPGHPVRYREGLAYVVLGTDDVEFRVNTAITWPEVVDDAVIVVAIAACG